MAGNKDLTQFRTMLITHFSLAELHLLCVDLGVDYENLPGNTKILIVTELVAFHQRRRELHLLMSEAEKKRPNFDWPNISEDFEPDKAPTQSSAEDIPTKQKTTPTEFPDSGDSKDKDIKHRRILCVIGSDLIFVIGILVGTLWLQNISVPQQDGMAEQTEVTRLVEVIATALPITQEAEVTRVVEVIVTAPPTTQEVEVTRVVEVEIAAPISELLSFIICDGKSYNCTPQVCLDECNKLGMQMATYNEVYAWAFMGKDNCAYMWMLDSRETGNPIIGFPMYSNQTNNNACGKTNTGDIPRMEGVTRDYSWDSEIERNCACSDSNLSD